MRAACVLGRTAHRIRCMEPRMARREAPPWIAPALRFAPSVELRAAAKRRTRAGFVASADFDVVLVALAIPVAVAVLGHVGAAESSHAATSDVIEVPTAVVGNGVPEHAERAWTGPRARRRTLARLPHG